MDNSLSLSKFKRLDTLVKRCLIEAGAALEEIRDEKLYLAGGFETFSEYCESIGRDYHWAWRQINASKVAKSLPISIPNVSTAQAVAKIPPPRRKEVIRDALEQSGGRLSAPAIKRAVMAPKRECDATGIPIPPEIHQLWNRNIEIKGMMAQVSAMRVKIEQAQESRDIAFRFVDFHGLIAKLKMVREELESAVSYAVCPDCNGVLFDGCATCRGAGAVPRHIWNAIPEEKKVLRK